MNKSCSNCLSTKSLGEFYAHPTTTDGRAAICKDCHKAAMKLRRRSDPSVQAYDLARAKSPDRRAHVARVSKQWRLDNPVAYAAQTKVGNALRDGKLTRSSCLFCGETKHVHAHHRDYSRPLDVIWLCAKCHQRLHAAFPETEDHRMAA